MKYKIRMLLLVVMLCAGIMISTDSSAKEGQAEVINRFMEIGEDTIAKTEPSDEAEDGKLLEEGQGILVLTRTKADWYQILCQGEILYIPTEKVKNQVIAKEAVEELGEADEQYLTISHDEMRSLVENGVVTEGAEYEQIMEEIALEKRKKVNQWFSGSVFLILLLVIGISGGGYYYLQRREDREKEKNRRHMEIIELDDGGEDEE